MPSVHGLHHVTVIAGDPNENFDFYVRTLGLRLVKRSVNQDAPDTYHLFYADGEGTPGTDLTFFPWPAMNPARPGAGLAAEVSFAVPAGSLSYWRGRLSDHGVGVAEGARFGDPVLTFTDPHGLALSLVATDAARPFSAWADGPVPPEHQLRGMHSVRLRVHDLGPTTHLLGEGLGFRSLGEEDGWHRWGVDDGAPGQLVDVHADAEAPRGAWGTGGIHHVAWRVADTEEEMEVRARVAALGLQPSSQIDRFWFRSVYFREPGGVLFELATDGPGFARDEDPAHLGETLILPPWMEPRRDRIEAALPPLRLPGASD